MIAKTGTFIGLGLVCSLGLLASAWSTEKSSEQPRNRLRLAGDPSLRLSTEPGLEPGTHRVVATVVDRRTGPVPGVEVFFGSSGPSAQALGAATTDANGEASVRYVDSPFGGTEEFQACIPNSMGFPRGDTLTTCAFIYTPPAECMLVVADGPGSDPFTTVSHTWQTNLSGIRDWYGVTQGNLASFTIPRAASGKTHAVKPTVTDEFYVQMLLWNPVFFPGNREQSSPGLRVRVYSTGQVIGTPYGPSDGMGIEVETFLAGGQLFLRFPFTIEAD